MEAVGRLSTAPVSAGRFEALLRSLGAGRPAPDLFPSLAAAWAEPHRAYHGTRHLADCLEQLDAAPADGADRALVEAALWFHDAVYHPRAGDNEVRSAAWAERALAGAGVPDERSAEIARLVLLTRHLAPAADPAGRLLCDVDLSILGRSAELYDGFERGIRAEYAWVPEPVYRAERSRILSGLLARDPLYQTPHFQARYESAARDNLRRALARLSSA